jgi:hypothetical protein
MDNDTYENNIETSIQLYNHRSNNFNLTNFIVQNYLLKEIQELISLQDFSSVILILDKSPPILNEIITKNNKDETLFSFLVISDFPLKMLDKYKEFINMNLPIHQKLICQSVWRSLKATDYLLSCVPDCYMINDIGQNILMLLMSCNASPNLHYQALQKGANPHHLDNTNKNILFYITSSTSLNLIHHYINLKVSLTSFDHNNHNLYHIAAIQNNTDLAYLLPCSLNIDLPNVYGNTPLHLSAEEAIIIFLLHRNASVGLDNNVGKSNYICVKQYPEALNYLKYRQEYLKETLPCIKDLNNLITQYLY